MISSRAFVHVALRMVGGYLLLNGIAEVSCGTAVSFDQWRSSWFLFDERLYLPMQTSGGLEFGTAGIIAGAVVLAFSRRLCGWFFPRTSSHVALVSHPEQLLAPLVTLAGIGLITSSVIGLNCSDLVQSGLWNPFSRGGEQEIRSTVVWTRLWIGCALLLLALVWARSKTLRAETGLVERNHITIALGITGVCYALGYVIDLSGAASSFTSLFNDPTKRVFFAWIFFAKPACIATLLVARNPIARLLSSSKNAPMTRSLLLAAGLACMAADLFLGVAHFAAERTTHGPNSTALAISLAPELIAAGGLLLLARAVTTWPRAATTWLVGGQGEE